MAVELLLRRIFQLSSLFLLCTTAQPEARREALPKCDASQIEVAEECPSTLGFDWELYGEALYRARSLVFLADVPGAREGVHALLKRATRPFHLAFECPLAVAATYFALAQIVAMQGHLRRALALVQMGFVFVRDRGFSECTPWPLQGWDMLLAGRNLVHKVWELDSQAVALDTDRSLRDGSIRIAVVTICAYADDETVRAISAANHELYTKLHNYDLFFYTDADQISPHLSSGMDVQDGVHKPFFWKVNAVRNVMDDSRGFDWILWADCDAFFMDPGRTIDSLIHMYTSNLTIPLRPGAREAPTERISADPRNVSLIVAVDSTGINNGVWLMRNDEWARQFLAHWWHSDILQGAGKEHNCSDQSTMQHALLQESALGLDATWDAAEGPVWPREVRIAAQEHLQSFHQATAMTVLSREWQDGDFIKHHPGCHYYKEPCKQLYWEAASIFEDKVRQLLQRSALEA